jgi:hypothetical protein
MATRRRRRRKTLLSRDARRRLTVVLLSLVGIFLLLVPRDAAKQIRLHAGPVLYPLRNLTEEWSMEVGVRPSGQGASQANQVRLIEENAAYQDALIKAAAVIADQSRRIEELERIREAFEGTPCRLVPVDLLPMRVAGGGVAARLAQGADNGVEVGGTVVAGRFKPGTVQAVERGQAVLTAAGLVGVVDAIGPRMSTVRLVTDPNSALKVQVVVQRGGVWQAGPTGVAIGTRDATGIRLKGIRRTDNVAPGDFLVTSPSAGSLVPPYLIVGKVVECRLPPGSGFYDIRVEPRVDLSAAKGVYVMVPEIGG